MTNLHNRVRTALEHAPLVSSKAGNSRRLPSYANLPDNTEAYFLADIPDPPNVISQGGGWSALAALASKNWVIWFSGGIFKPER